MAKEASSLLQPLGMSTVVWDLKSREPFLLLPGVGDLGVAQEAFFLIDNYLLRERFILYVPPPPLQALFRSQLNAKSEPKVVTSEVLPA